jgi:predicted nucleic acid-binding Zn ribbon protein
MKRCNRRACQSTKNVVCVHRDTQEMYCVNCAAKINKVCNEVVVPFPYKNGETFTFTKSGAKVTIVENRHNGFYTVEKDDGKRMTATYEGLIEEDLP